MKIGIVTWTHFCNYGTVLQAFALQKYLQNEGEDAEVIDYIGKLPIYEKLKPRKLFGIIKRKLKRSASKESMSRKHKVFDLFVKKNIKKSIHCSNKSDLERLNNVYDIFICGSDQIWNTYCPYYYLDFVNKDKTIAAYAPSFGRSIIKDNKIKRRSLLNRFDFLSVREENAVSIVKQLTKNQKKDVSVVCDPTLLLEKDDWKKLLSQGECNNKYIFCYMLGDNENNIKLVEYIAKVKNLKVKYLLGNSESNEEILSPEEFLNMIWNAEYICTDSFHGIMFSLIFNKQFFALKRFADINKISQNSRVYSILNKLNLKNRIICSEIDINNLLDEEIDYSKVGVLLQEYAINSKEYLSKIINKDKE